MCLWVWARSVCELHYQGTETCWFDAVVSNFWCLGQKHVSHHCVLRLTAESTLYGFISLNLILPP